MNTIVAVPDICGESTMSPLTSGIGTPGSAISLCFNINSAQETIITIKFAG
jgi:hypothetical protein